MNAMTKIASSGADTASNEVRFPIEQILTSATDQRGVIGFASPRFCEVSGFTSDELLGAPHKLVRHPDTPKGVFYLLWDHLKAGKPVCAYVKNKTKSGGYYWVLAVITHTENGYLSARIRPGSELFEATKAVYADLLKEEASGMTPEHSATLLTERLQEMGYDDIKSYGYSILNEEFKLRNIVDAEHVTSFALMDDLAGLVCDMQNLVNSIEQGFARVRGEPVNLRILAGRLEGAGAALGTISQNYDAMAKEMHGLVGRLHDPESGALRQMSDAVGHGRAALQMAQLLKQARSDATIDASMAAEGLRLLEDHNERLQQLSRTRLIEIASVGKSIPDICRSLRRRINGLDVVKLLCKVESGRMRDVDSGLDGIIARLENFHDNTDRHLAELSAKSSQITQKGASL
ncbi:PAS domain-containing protein [Shimia marina]|uniref:Aerotaxis receptor n=1 Tax=Shimia marina TaxID=321267 RepID=A0A0N7LRZ3_9RHOB|nr:PAS domain-containing protein [Shimia marina]CUH52180.1 Aerotaxis receptor [Shimia marina]SFE72250.1 aerotaxis receptor [Shimia marina]